MAPTPSALVTKPISHLQLAPGSVLQIPGVSWSEFEAVLEELGHHRAERVSYFQQTLEIMAPSPEHEKPIERSWQVGTSQALEELESLIRKFRV